MVNAPKTFVAGAARSQYARVKMNGANTVATAGAADFAIGFQEKQSFGTTDETITVRVRNSEGSVKMIAAGAISAGANVYAAASGKVASTGFVLEGKAVTAASADGDIIEVIAVPNPDVFANVGTVAAAGSAQGDAAALTHPVNICTGADGTKGVILSTSSTMTVVYNTHATNGLKVYPPTGGDINDGSQNAAVTIEGKTQAIFVNLDGTTFSATFTANT